MNKETLKSIIIEGQELLGELHPVGRSFVFEKHARYVFTGVRQAGKSYLLYLRALQMIAEGEDLHRMLFVNFDDERLINVTAAELDEILQAYFSLFELKPILFLDEIQNIDGWEHFARRLANQKYEVYITGSNARMLSRDIASTLGARYIEQRIFPYSFREYLKAGGIILNDDSAYGSTRGTVERLMRQYFEWGGFPELAHFVNKRQWLNEIYEKIILGDIILRNRIKNETALRLVMKRLAENIKNPTSYNRLANMVKSTGVSTSVSAVIEYVEYARSACMLFTLTNFASKFAERETIRKHYFVDNGLLNIFLDDSDTALLENICAIALHRKDPGNLYYYNKEVELDFYLADEKRGIQAAYSLHDTATLDREVKALSKFHSMYGLNKAEIVTYGEEDTITADGLTIDVVPLWKWLLKEDRT